MKNKITLAETLNSILPLLPSGSTVTIDIHDFTNGKSLRLADNQDFSSFILADEYKGFQVTNVTMDNNYYKKYSLFISAVKEY